MTLPMHSSTLSLSVCSASVLALWEGGVGLSHVLVFFWWHVFLFTVNERCSVEVVWVWCSLCLVGFIRFRLCEWQTLCVLL